MIQRKPAQRLGTEHGII
jgi:hypothetical protein